MTTQEAVDLFSRKACAFGLGEDPTDPTAFATMQIVVPPSLEAIFVPEAQERLVAASEMLRLGPRRRKNFVQGLSADAKARFFLANLYHQKLYVDWWLLLFGIWRRTWGCALEKVGLSPTASDHETPDLQKAWDDNDFRIGLTLKDGRTLTLGVYADGDYGERLHLWFWIEDQQGEIDPQTNALVLPPEHWTSHEEDESQWSTVALVISGTGDCVLDTTPLLHAAQELIKQFDL